MQLGIADDLGDTIFTQGQLADASAADGIADPGVVTGTTTDPAWEPEFKQPIHGCILITGESKRTISERLQELEIILIGTFKTIIRVDGAVRPGDEAGHEHFGFQDGLSQPPVTGFRDPNTGEAPTGELLFLAGTNGYRILVFTVFHKLLVSFS
jgi:deferrochelatase/peroxidase EfeB